MSPKTRAAYELLKAADGGWVAGGRLIEASGSRFGARLFELRHEYGLTIEKRPAPNGSHVPWYRLVPEDEQLAMELAS